MGREIRRVPPNWEHPKDEKGEYLSMYDEEYETVANEWFNDCIAWFNGTHKDIINDPDLKKEYPFYWEYEGDPPDRNYYRPKFTEDPTWFQVYQTVSEGSPVTPPFATKEELVEYLVQNGDFWDQKRRHGGWNRENAERFVGSEWAPSLMFNTTTNEIKTPRDGI